MYVSSFFSLRLRRMYKRSTRGECFFNTDINLQSGVKPFLVIVITTDICVGDIYINIFKLDI